MVKCTSGFHTKKQEDNTMLECPKCESRNVESYDRFTGGISMLILAPVAAFIFTLFGASATLTVIIFILMIIGGIMGLGLTMASGRKVATCKNCNHTWTYG